MTTGEGTVQKAGVTQWSQGGISTSRLFTAHAAAGRGAHIHKNIHIKQTECAPQTLRRWCWQRSQPGALIHPHSCVVLQLISARTLETALISFHKSSICAFCSSAKECQVKLFWTPAQTHYCPTIARPSPEAHRGKQACG